MSFEITGCLRSTSTWIVVLTGRDTPSFAVQSIDAWNEPSVDIGLPMAVSILLLLSPNLMCRKEWLYTDGGIASREEPVSGRASITAGVSEPEGKIERRADSSESITATVSV